MQNLGVAPPSHLTVNLNQWTFTISPIKYLEWVTIGYCDRPSACPNFLKESNYPPYSSHIHYSYRLKSLVWSWTSNLITRPTTPPSPISSSLFFPSERDRGLGPMRKWVLIVDFRAQLRFLSLDASSPSWGLILRLPSLLSGYCDNGLWEDNCINLTDISSKSFPFACSSLDKWRPESEWWKWT